MSKEINLKPLPEPVQPIMANWVKFKSPPVRMWARKYLKVDMIDFYKWFCMLMGEGEIPHRAAVIYHAAGSQSFIRGQVISRPGPEGNGVRLTFGHHFSTDESSKPRDVLREDWT